MSDPSAHPELSPAPTVHSLRHALEGCLGIPFVAGNRVRVLQNGVQAFPAMLAAIAAAQATIEFQTFIYWRGDIARRFAEALGERARAGVRVLVLLDAVGCLPMRRELIEQMRAAGVQVVLFRPVARWQFWRIAHRSHRKVLVCDGRIGFTGGFGIAEQWEGDAEDPAHWRDTHFCVEGPAVHGLQAAFCSNWLEATGELHAAAARVQPLPADGDVDVLALRSTAAPRWSDAGTLLWLLIDGARRRLCIATAYFVPDPLAVELLQAAVRRGVEVDVLIPGPHCDHRVSELAGADSYGPLLEAGVRLHAYQPTMMHCKVITVDGAISCVGSANFNQRSLAQDDEVSLVVDHAGVTGTLQEQFAADLQRAEPIRLRQWRRRGPLRRAAELVAALVRPQV